MHSHHQTAILLPAPLLQVKNANYFCLLPPRTTRCPRSLFPSTTLVQVCLHASLSYFTLPTILVSSRAPGTSFSPSLVSMPRTVRVALLPARVAWMWCLLMKLVLPPLAWSLKMVMVAPMFLIRVRLTRSRVAWVGVEQSSPLRSRQSPLSPPLWFTTRMSWVTL